MLTVGSLFSGIGGFDLGLERAGMRVVWQCEQDDYCRRVLARHWPGVPCHPDVRALVADAETGRDERQGVLSRPPLQPVSGGESGLVPVPVPYVDVLAGGFPCQDLSVAGKGAGIDGDRSGLWAEFARLIGELRPRYVVVENVSALLARGMGRVLGDLAARGYDAEWDCLPASAFGAPHRRDRLWVVGYSNRPRLERRGRYDERPDERVVGPAGCEMANPEGQRREPRSRSGCAVGTGEQAEVQSEGRVALRAGAGGGADPWLTEPDVGRVAHGVPARVDRLRSLGNALVPQIAEWIGRRIIEWEELAA